MTKPGPRNLITDVSGITVGNAHDEKARTGVTVVLPGERCVAAGDVRGGGPGTRETDALEPHNLVDAIDAVVLSGGSVYGLEAHGGVAAWLGARGRGFSMAGEIVSPVVPGAILFDLTNGGDKNWGETPPYRALGMEAAAGAEAGFALGNAGAGYGAQAGAYKGGLGSASAITDDGFEVGALVAVNPFGSPVMPGSDAFWAWHAEQGKEFGGRRPDANWTPPVMDFPTDTKMGGPQKGGNTTIGVVAVNAALTPAEAKRVTMMAQDGYARAIRPIHTLFDGDTVYALATGAVAVPGPRALLVSRLGMIAADCMARAVARGVYEAETLGTARSYRDVFGV